MININEYLTSLEIAHGITILYACECGSRAYGYHKSNSDYDIRFFYKKPLPYYLSIQEHTKDSIEYKIEDLDIMGWDIIKFCKQLHKGNAHAFEWLNAPIVYRENGLTKKIITENSNLFFMQEKIINHYYHVSNNNYKLFSSENNEKMKTHCYVVYNIIMMIFIKIIKSFPDSIDIYSLLNFLERDRETKLYKIPYDLIHRILILRKSNEVLSNDEFKYINEWCSLMLGLFKGLKKETYQNKSDELISILDKVICYELNNMDVSTINYEEKF